MENDLLFDTNYYEFGVIRYRKIRGSNDQYRIFENNLVL